MNPPDQRPSPTYASATYDSVEPSPAGDIRLRVPSMLARRVSVLTGAAVAGVIVADDPIQTLTTTHSPWTTMGT